MNSLQLLALALFVPKSDSLIRHLSKLALRCPTEFNLHKDHKKKKTDARQTQKRTHKEHSDPSSLHMKRILKTSKELIFQNNVGSITKMT